MSRPALFSTKRRGACVSASCQAAWCRRRVRFESIEAAALGVRATAGLGSSMSSSERGRVGMWASNALDVGVCDWYASRLDTAAAVSAMEDERTRQWRVLCPAGRHGPFLDLLLFVPAMPPMQLIGRVSKAGKMTRTVTVTVDRLVVHKRTLKARSRFFASRARSHTSSAQRMKRTKNYLVHDEGNCKHHLLRAMALTRRSSTRRRRRAHPELSSNIQTEALHRRATPQVARRRHRRPQSSGSNAGGPRGQELAVTALAKLDSSTSARRGQSKPVAFIAATILTHRHRQRSGTPPQK